ncbi:MAG TPA: hypothetical protein VFU88_01030 [Ktedonobacterales bacterium]|nr:hypothetical protein [Ktedonobacterales bacterium]
MRERKKQVGVGAALPAGLLALAMLAGCGILPAPEGPTVLSDTRPGNLNLVVVVQDMISDASLQPALNVTFLFQTDSGHAVRLVKGETVICGDTALQNNDSSFDGQVPIPADPSTPISCTYTSGTAAADISFVLPPTPVILSPKAGDTVTRAKDLTVLYTPSGGRGIQATAENGTVRGAVTGLQQPDNGRYGPLDTTQLQPGAGRVVVDREYASRTLSDSGFRAAQLNMRVDGAIDVTWT